MRHMWAVAPVAAWWTLYVVVLAPWELHVPEFTPARTTVLQALVDALCALVAYGASSAMLVESHRKAAEAPGCLPLVVFALMLVTEIVLRYYGAGMSMGGDPLRRVASVCPFGIPGFSAWPAVGALLGAVIGLAAPGRR